MGKTTRTLLKTITKNQRAKPSRTFRAAGLIFQLNRIINAFRTQKATGTTREVAKFITLTKGGRG